MDEPSQRLLDAFTAFSHREIGEPDNTTAFLLAQILEISVQLRTLHLAVMERLHLSDDEWNAYRDMAIRELEQDYLAM